MKIKNTSNFSTPFLKEMIRWVAKEMNLPKSSQGKGAYPVPLAVFRKRKNRSYSGRAFPYSEKIVVSIGPDTCFPRKHNGYKRACKPADGSDYPTLSDSIDALIMVTAHELGHISHFRLGHFGKGSEDRADAPARYVFKKFKENKEKLLAEWTPVQENVATVSLKEKRAEEVNKKLALWTKKLKIAKTKVAKYRQKMKYYEKAMASS